MIAIADGSNAIDGPRSSDRSRVVSIAITTSVLNRGLAGLVPLLMVPLGLGYLGAEGYGAWATVLAATGMAAFADLGIGTGLMTRLGQLDLQSSKDRIRARTYISSAYLAVLLLSALGLAALWTVSATTSWAELLGVNPAHRDVDRIVMAALTAFVVNIPASLIVRVQYGVTQQGRSNLWQACGRIASLAAAWIAIQINVGHGWFVALAAFAPIAISLVNTFHFYAHTEMGQLIGPKISAVSKEAIRGILGLGLRFVLVSSLMLASFSLDPWIVARTTSLSVVPTYTIPYRLFAFVGTISVMLSTPLWPIHARAVHRGDVEWMRKITTRMTKWTSGIVFGASVMLVATGRPLLRIWLHNDEVRYNVLLWCGLGAYWTVQTATAARFMVQNGAEVLRPQVIGYSVLLLTVPLKLYVSAEFGFVWIPWVGALTYIIIIWPACRAGYRASLTIAAGHRDRRGQC